MRPHAQAVVAAIAAWGLSQIERRLQRSEIHARSRLRESADDHFFIAAMANATPAARDAKRAPSKNHNQLNGFQFKKYWYAMMTTLNTITAINTLFCCLSMREKF
jgi:hypothetical protein